MLQRGFEMKLSYKEFDEYFVTMIHFTSGRNRRFFFDNKLCNNPYTKRTPKTAINVFFLRQSCLLLSKEVSWEDRFRPSSLADITTARGGGLSPRRGSGDDGFGERG